MTGGTPFIIPKPRDEDKNLIRDIQRQLAEGTMPFDISVMPLSPQLKHIITGCCNPDPFLRLPAPYVAELLSDLMFRNPPIIECDYPALQSTQRHILSRVLALRDMSSSDKKATPPENITEQDAKVLKDSSNQEMDPTSCFLFGAAIWYDIVPVSIYDAEVTEPIGNRPHSKGELFRTNLRA